MANIFSEASKKRFPKTAKDCIEPDYVSQSLWHWAQGIERYGKIALIITIILGILFFVISMASGDAATIGVAFLVVPIVTAVAAIIEYLTYHTIALLIGALASLVQNTAISANIALLNTNGLSDASTEETEKAADETLSPESFVWHPVSEATATSIGETNIKCTNCHRVQFKGNKTCTQCGARFTEIEQ